jgi:hypothetical protein
LKLGITRSSWSQYVAVVCHHARSLNVLNYRNIILVIPESFWKKYRDPVCISRYCEKFNIHIVLAHHQVAKKTAIMSFPEMTKSNLKIILFFSRTYLLLQNLLNTALSVFCFLLYCIFTPKLYHCIIHKILKNTKHSMNSVIILLGIEKHVFLTLQFRYKAKVYN